MFLRPIFVLFISYSLLIHSLLIPIHFYLFPIHCLFISFSCSFISFHFLCIPIHCLFISFSFSFISFISFDLRNLSKFQKAWIFFLINLLFKNYWFQAPNQLGKGVPHKSPKKWLIKGIVNKVLDLDGLFISYSMLIHFLFKFYSCPIQLLLWSHSFLFINFLAFISKGFQ